VILNSIQGVAGVCLDAIISLQAAVSLNEIAVSFDLVVLRILCKNMGGC